MVLCWGSKLRCTGMHIDKTSVNVGQCAPQLHWCYAIVGLLTECRRTSTDCDVTPTQRNALLTESEQTLWQAGFLRVCVTSMGVVIQLELRHLASPCDAIQLMRVITRSKCHRGLSQPIFIHAQNLTGLEIILSVTLCQMGFINVNLQPVFGYYSLNLYSCQELSDGGQPKATQPVIGKWNGAISKGIIHWKILTFHKLYFFCSQCLFACLSIPLLKSYKQV